ncbi:hypothetical protein HMPREF1586_00821 [Gardnerella vaginalis JCP8522]|nr:hypothetical protein HMPREF1586_00821 [Gardnerella vaginalis JCP8522]
MFSASFFGVSRKFFSANLKVVSHKLQIFCVAIDSKQLNGYCST